MTGCGYLCGYRCGYRCRARGRVAAGSKQGREVGQGRRVDLAAGDGGDDLREGDGGDDEDDDKNNGARRDRSRKWRRGLGQRATGEGRRRSVEAAVKPSCARAEAAEPAAVDQASRVTKPLVQQRPKTPTRGSVRREGEHHAMAGEHGALMTDARLFCAKKSMLVLMLSCSVCPRCVERVVCRKSARYTQAGSASRKRRPSPQRTV